jgi:hypothetical protein
MKPAWRYALATAFVAAIAAPYAGYLVRGTMPFIHDPQGMAGTGLVLGAAAVVTAGWEAFGGGRALTVAFGLGVGVFGLGAAAVWLEWNTLVLAAFMASIGLFWVYEAARHLEMHTPAHTRHITGRA